MTIHSTHPFADADRDASRQLRGRLGNRVTLWCAGELDGQPRAAGLTVGSTQLVPGDPWRVVAHVSEESDLLETIEKTGRATISLLGWPHRNLAEMFAGVAPAPGGPFRYGEFTQTGHGPLLTGIDSWAAVELESTAEVGWMRQLVCTVAQVEVGPDAEPLHHQRGRYLTLG